MVKLVFPDERFDVKPRRIVRYLDCRGRETSLRIKTNYFLISFFEDQRLFIVLLESELFRFANETFELGVVSN